jgi:hypothetical protein
VLKLLAFVALFAGFCWVGTTVQLGSHTLFGHLHAIAETKESQDLFDGTKQSTRPLVDDMRRRIAGVPDPKGSPPPGGGADPERTSVAASRHPDAGPPQESVTPSERRRLRKLLSSADRVSAHP